MRGTQDDGARLRKSPWLLRPHPVPQADLRLFCLPHAGGDTWMFRDWHLVLSPTVEVCPIRLPGRGSRIDEPSFTEIVDLAGALAEGLAEALEKPFAIFGHSMGALVGFELARRLRRDRGKSPVMLGVAACPAPILPSLRPPLSQLPPDLMIEAMHRRYGTGRALADSEDLMRLMLPILRADFGACERYVPVEDQPLDCPIAAYGGTNDRTVENKALDAWRDQTTNAFLRQMIEGDHFFPIGAKLVLVRLLKQDLAWSIS